MKRTPTALMLLLSLAAVPTTAGANNSENWYLMSRHGECAEIRSLQRKIPDIGNIKDPQAFSEFMQAKGHKVFSSAMPDAQGKVLLVNVPEKGLSLIFVKGSLCKEFIKR
jgi:hypothetical protein